MGCSSMDVPEQRFSSSCSVTEGGLLLLATMRGSYAHPDQSLELALLHKDLADLWAATSSSILPFFILRGEPFS
jgi:hypothetical protein